MRAFFCIPIKPDTASSIGRIARDVRERSGMRASWVRAQNYHVTLRFLGEIDPLLTVELERIGRRAAERIEPFPLSLDRLGAFPSPESARVLWIGGDAPPAFHGLASSLRHELGRLGFPAERDAAVAHVTLARIKGRPDPDLPRLLDECRPARGLPVSADRLILMESVLMPDGPAYTPLFAVRLAGAKTDAG